MSSDTIAALATPPGVGSIAVIRLSGPESWPIAAQLARGTQPWEPARTYYHWLEDPQTGELLDETLILPFKAPRSFTGEDVVEIQCHGGPVLSRLILQTCYQLGARTAEAGEFTRRAVINGRLDLAQAESVLDLIHAEGETVARLAASNLRHRHVSRYIASLCESIGEVQAALVASIDFPDEVDEPERGPLIETLNDLITPLSQHLARSRANHWMRDGLDIAILGRPNAGKSSLFNTLLMADRAIVTDIPGTTRDLLRETLHVGGVAVTLVDTAGLRQATDQVEQIGVGRSREALASAQGLIYVMDADKGPSEEDRQTLRQISDQPCLCVMNKSDLLAPDVSRQTTFEGHPVVYLSALSPSGAQPVLDWLSGLVQTLPSPATMVDLLSERQSKQLEGILVELHDAVSALAQETVPLDIVTVPLTNALQALQGLLGFDTTESVLDNLFSRFCVGK